MQTKPYFYVIKHVPSGRLYAGIRSASGCHPDELLRPDGYTTSSKEVKNLIDSDGLESFRVLYVVTEKDLGIDVYLAEYEFLTCHDAAKSDIWLNKTNGGGCRGSKRNIPVRKYVAHNIHTGEEIIASARELYETYNIPGVRGAATKKWARLVKDTYYIYPVGSNLEDHIRNAENNRKKKEYNYKEGASRGAIKSSNTKRMASLEKYGVFELHFLSGDRAPIKGTLVDLYNLGYKKVYSWERNDSISLKLGVVLIREGEDLAEAIDRKTRKHNEIKQRAIESSALKNSAVSKGRPQKNSKFYRVFKDGKMVCGRDILKNHCKNLNIVYTTARLAISKNRAVKQGYMFVECE